MHVSYTKGVLARASRLRRDFGPMLLWFSGIAEQAER